MISDDSPDTARDVNGGNYLQVFLVTAVVAMLGTRFYLTLTGFPRLGGGELHFAHLLWGGQLMLVALVLLLSLIGRHAKWLGSLVGGAGFGLFIDELGKFVTADNDYFFRPAIALIYVVFVTLFLVFRAIERRSLSSAELLANAANQLPELVLGDTTNTEVARTLALLERSHASGPFAEAIHAAVTGTVCAPAAPPSRLVRATHWAWNVYEHVGAWPYFERTVELVFIVQAGLGLLAILGLASSGVILVGLDHVSPGGLGIAELGFGLVSFGMVLLGVISLRRSGRLAAYRWFERSVLVSIFFTQVVVFWQDQLAGISGLIWNLVLLSALRFAIRQEQARGVAATLRDPRSRSLLPTTGQVVGDP